MAPRISVVIASYNHARYLRQCIQSVLNQTLRPAEVVVVDDGSTDGSREIIGSFGKAIRPIYQSNAGTYAALNAGMAGAAGEWIAIQNSDDVWMPQKLERQMDLVCAHPQVGLVHTNVRCIDDSGGPLARPSTVPDYAGPPVSFMLAQLVHTMPVVISSALFAQKLLGHVGAFDPRYRGGGDVEFCLRASQRYPFGFVDEPLVLLRKHPDNSGTNPTRLPASWQRADWKLLCGKALPEAAECLFRMALEGVVVRREASLALASLGVIHTRSGEPRLARHCLLLAGRLEPLRWRTWLRYASAVVARARG